MPSLNDLDKAVNFLTRLFVKIKKCFLPQWQSDVNFYSLYTLRNFWTYQMTAVRTKVFEGFLWQRPGLQKKQNGLLRHSNVQSNTSDTDTAPTSGTFKGWNSCLMNVRLRKVPVEEERFPSRYTGFDSVTGKKNSPVIKGHDGTTHRKEWRQRTFGEIRSLAISLHIFKPTQM